MAPLKKVSSLRDLCLQSFKKWITTIAESMFRTSDTFPSSNLNKRIEKLKILLDSCVPSSLHESITTQILYGLQEFHKLHSVSDSSKASLKRQAIVRSLSSAAPFIKMKEFSFENWVEPILFTPYQLLCKATNLKTLNCNNSFRKNKWLFQQVLLRSIPSFLNLTCFIHHNHCSNNILAKISTHCKSIQVIRVQDSKNVTDDCIVSLVPCLKLQVVDFSDTSVTENGYTKFLINAKSKTLFHVIGFEIQSENLFCRKEDDLTPFRTFQLRELVFWDCNSEEVSLACQFFPYLMTLIIKHRGRFDFSSLSKLDNLQKLHFISDWNFDHIDSYGGFLSVRGSSITTLRLCFVHGPVVKIISDIAVSCPNIECLMFFPCHLYNETSEFPKIENEVKPFQKLTEFKSISEISLLCLKFILQHAHNIAHISLSFCEPISDEFLKDIFRINSLKKLSSLKIVGRSNKISSEMLKFIILNCDDVTSLEGFTNSSTIDEDVLKSVQDFILTNNYNLPLR